MERRSGFDWTESEEEDHESKTETNAEFVFDSFIDQNPMHPANQVNILASSYLEIMPPVNVKPEYSQEPETIVPPDDILIRIPSNNLFYKFPIQAEEELQAADKEICEDKFDDRIDGGGPTEFQWENYVYLIPKKEPKFRNGNTKRRTF